MAEYVNKVIYGSEVLIDLSPDSITAEDLAAGKTAHDASGAPITGTNTKDADTQDATATESDLLTGKTAYARGALLTGSMANNGAIAETIVNLDDVINPAVGYHDGSGTVQIDPVEQAKIIPGNIREGVEILGITGTMTGSEDVHLQSKTVTPTTDAQTVLPDEGYEGFSQVTVEAIPYTEAENSAGGLTVTIG